MWPFNSKEKKESTELQPYYVVDMNKVETIDQLKDIIRLTHLYITHELDPEIRIGEGCLKDFPALKNAVTKVDGKDA